MSSNVGLLVVVTLLAGSLGAWLLSLAQKWWERRQRRDDALLAVVGQKGGHGQREIRPMVDIVDGISKQIIQMVDGIQELTSTAGVAREAWQRTEDGVKRAVEDLASVAVSVDTLLSQYGLIWVDVGGRIVRMNARAETITGYPESELIGQYVQILVPDRVADQHSAWRHAYSENPRTRPMGGGRSLTLKRKDGSELPVDIALVPYQNDNLLIQAAIQERMTAVERVEMMTTKTGETIEELSVYTHERVHKLRGTVAALVTAMILLLQKNQLPVPDELAAETDPPPTTGRPSNRPAGNPPSGRTAY